MTVRLVASATLLLLAHGPNQQFSPARDPDEHVESAVRHGVAKQADLAAIESWVPREVAFSTGDGKLDQLISTRQMRIHAFGLPRTPDFPFDHTWIAESTIVLWRMYKWDCPFGPGFVGIARWRGVNYFVMGQLFIYGSF